MDALITTILAGVVVAVVGAFAAYYFGGRRERQKQAYEARRDEERQREAKQDELRERRIEALAEIQGRADSVVVDLKNLAESIVRLHEEEMPKGIARHAIWKEYFDKYARLAQQRDAIAKEMGSLRAYYDKQIPYLETTSCTLFTSFDREFKKRYMPLSRNLYDEEARQGHQILNGIVNGSAAQRFITAVAQVSHFGLDVVLNSRAARENLNEEFSNTAESIESIRNWNFQAHKAAFDKEIKRIAGDLP